MTTRRQTLLLMGSAALAACSTPAIVTRNDRDPFEGGIGGTGIVGTLYGYGSLLVNGLRVELDGRTTYRSPFGPVNASSLLPGHLLTMSATRSSNRLVAREVSIDYALVGLLRHDHGVTSVNGVPLINPGDALGHGVPGTRVAVSGAWTAAGVRPNRIESAGQTPDLIAGTANVVAGAGLAIGGVAIETSAALPSDGSYVLALGQAGTDRFIADRLHDGRFAQISSLKQLSVEGYLEPSRQAPGLRISGLGHNFARDVRATMIGQRRAICFGPYIGRFAAQRGYIVPDTFDARRRLLTPGLTSFSGQVVTM